LSLSTRCSWVWTGVRISDQTIATVGNNCNDVLEWFADPKMRYEEQIELLLADLRRKRTGRRRKDDGSIEEVEFDYLLIDFSSKTSTTKSMTISSRRGRLNCGRCLPERH